MPCFQVSGRTGAHAKVVRAGNAAMGLWVRCGTYAAEQWTDGFIPAEIAKLYGRAAEVRALVAAGLWHAAGHDCADCPQPAADGYVMHGYLDDNPSAEEGRAKRAAASERQRRSRAAKPTQSRVSHGVTENGVTRDSRVTHASVTRESRRESRVGHTQAEDDLPPPHPPLKEPPSPSGKGAPLRVTPQSQRDSETNPQVSVIVGAWIEAAKALQGSRPAGNLVARVGKQARTLLAEGHPADRLEAAARSAGSRGWDDIGRELLRLGAATRPAQAVESAGGWDV